MKQGVRYFFPSSSQPPPGAVKERFPPPAAARISRLAHFATGTEALYHRVPDFVNSAARDTEAAEESLCDLHPIP